MYHLARWSAAGRRWCAGLRHSTLGWLQSRPLPGGRPWGDRLAPVVSAPAVSARVQWRLGVALVMFTAALGAVLMVRPVVELPVDLEPAPGTAQCNYELLGAFSKYMRSRGKGLRYTLAAGTLLGAMRNEPPGLLQWEHDVDVYMPARDASQLLRRLQRDCAATAWYHWRSAAASLAASPLEPFTPGLRLSKRRFWRERRLAEERAPRIVRRVESRAQVEPECAAAIAHRLLV